MLKLLVITTLIAAACGTSAAQTKRSMTVDDFSWATVQTAVQAVFGTNVDIGKGINAMMVKRIAQDGKFTIVERRNIGTVLKEQDFGASNRVKKGTNARIGESRRRLHADGRHCGVRARRPAQSCECRRNCAEPEASSAARGRQQSGRSAELSAGRQRDFRDRGGG
jgi:hypothetical protein